MLCRLASRTAGATRVVLPGPVGRQLQLTSALYQPTRWASTDSKSGTNTGNGNGNGDNKVGLLQRYEAYLENNWPRAYQLHRCVIDGSKSCLADVRTYFRIRKDLDTGKSTLASLSRSELETYIQTRREVSQLIAIVILAPLPLTMYIFAFAVVFFPRYILTRHFWSPAQRYDYWTDSLKSVGRHHFASIIVHLPEPYPEKFPIPLESVKDVKVTPIDELTFGQVYHLATVHHVMPISGLRNLLWRAEAIKALDDVLRKDLKQISGLTTSELFTQLFLRRLNFEGLSDDEMRTLLLRWLRASEAFDANPSSLLHAPVLSQAVYKSNRH